MKQKSLRIIHCFRSPIGGVFRHIRDLAAQQQQSGHQVGVICEACKDGPLETAQFAEMLPNLSLGLHRIPIRRQIGISDISAIMTTKKHLQWLQPDIVHGHGAKGGTYARLAVKLLKLRHRTGASPYTFYSPHGGSLHYDAGSLTGKAMFTIERWQERFTCGLIFVSDYEAQIYRHKVGSPRCPSVTIHNGISAAEFAPVALDPDAADFLFIGMMRDIKGPDLFIRALAQLHQQQRSNNVTLSTAAIIGDGPQKQTYIQLADALGLSRSIRFYPSMPVREALRHGKVFVLSSRAESLPYIMLEVLAAQRDVIATRIGGLAEILGDDFETFCMAEPQAIAEKMQLITRMQNSTVTISRAQQLVRTAFRQDIMAQNIDNFYLQCMEKL